tara:strand:+ start:1904 stop:2806 length:903 start_codon:yes stop_codon:yes gene_type:complete
MSRLILIHGINNEKNSDKLIREDWTRALAIGASSDPKDFLTGTEIRTAFYGKLLFDETNSWDGSMDHARHMSASSGASDYADEDVAALYREVQKELGVTDEQVAAYLDEDDELSSKRMGKGIHKKWLKAIARCLEDVVPTKGKFLARRFLRQAAAYLFKPGLRDSIDSMVLDQVFQNVDSGEETVVISHSLGTIVAYSILRRLTLRQPIPLFITAGSPLGIEVVKQRIGGPFLRPESVANWLNLSDKEDFVALHPELMKSNFGPAQIENVSSLNNGHEDPHSITRYLSHSVVGQRVMAVL